MGGGRERERLEEEIRVRKKRKRGVDARLLRSREQRHSKGFVDSARRGEGKRLLFLFLRERERASERRAPLFFLASSSPFFFYTKSGRLFSLFSWFLHDTTGQCPRVLYLFPREHPHRHHRRGLGRLCLGREAIPLLSLQINPQRQNDIEPRPKRKSSRPLQDPLDAHLALLHVPELPRQPLDLVRVPLDHHVRRGLVVRGDHLDAHLLAPLAVAEVVDGR